MDHWDYNELHNPLVRYLVDTSIHSSISHTSKTRNWIEWKLLSSFLITSDFSAIDLFSLKALRHPPYWIRSGRELTEEEIFKSIRIKKKSIIFILLTLETSKSLLNTVIVTNKYDMMCTNEFS